MKPFNQYFDELELLDEGVKEITMALLSLGAMAYESDYILKQLNKRPEPIEQKIQALSTAKKIKPNISLDQAYSKLMSFHDKEKESIAPAPIVPKESHHDSMNDNNLLSFIKKHEKFFPEKYWDYKQYSIGYGTKAGPKDHKISEQEASRRLADVVAHHKKKVLEAAKQWGYNWNKHQIDALTSFRFNIGSISELTNNGTRDDKEIANKMLEYTGAGDKELSGLVDRRREEQQLFLR